MAIGITRREALCNALEARLQLPDFCSLKQATPGVKNLFVNTARNLALSVPGGYTVNAVGYTVKQGATVLLGPATFDVTDPNAAPSLDIVLPPSTGSPLRR